MLTRVSRFFQKSADDRKLAFLSHRNALLSKLPFIPVRVVLNDVRGNELSFIWHNFLQAWNFESWHRQSLSHFEYKCWDAHELKAAFSLIEPGYTVLDVGAWRGMFSLVASQIVTETGRVIAFEPSSRERFWFAVNKILNGWPSIQIENMALGAQPSSQTFYRVTDGDTTMNSLRELNDTHRHSTQTVEVTSLDEYVTKNQIAKVDFLKVDIEGGERDFFLGAKEVLTTHRPKILCEVTDATCNPWGYDAKELIHMLSDLGYSWFEADLHGELAPHKATAKYSTHANYFALPAN